MGSPHQEAPSGTGGVWAEDDYICCLPQGVRAVAARDLGEDDVTRQRMLSALRKWIRGHPTIVRCRLDANFLLRFLRMKKFRVSETQTLLEKYLRMREQHPLWFRALDPRDPGISDLIDRGYFFALPDRDDDGRRVFFSIPNVVDPTRHTAADMMRTTQLGLEAMLEDEENQIRGLSYIFDERDVGFNVIGLWTPSTVAKALQCCEKTMPIRHKEIHFVNLPTALLAIFEFAKTLLSDKIKNRFQVHSDEAKLRKKVPTRILPKEYGGTIPLQDMIKMYRRELEALRPRILQLDHLSIAPKRKTALDRALGSVGGSFRRLEID
ncbi:alpha-tocopherol transfer protein-like [Oratosquilla oratoria]|uniref:alpha-tocopherol transfer protein-like n=1 Tax=Oratosquilla oratoria TaxID=337810 RepID=UPI003F757A6D